MYHCEKERTAFSRLLFFFFLSFASLLFLAVFSYYTSPLSHCENGSDAAFFRLVGQGITKGYLPYRDFFDMKGPFLFFIEFIGQRISYGRLGIFIVQWINLLCVLIIICKIFDHYNISNRYIQICLLLILAFIASFTFEGGNLTEEFSLIPLLSCLYICLVYFDKSEAPSKFYQKDIFWYAGVWFGFCFGLLVMIRITNAAFICAMILVIVINLIKKSQLKELSICIIMFLVGLIISLAPAVLYYSYKGLLHEMLNAVFILGIKYSAEKSFTQHVAETIISDQKQLLLLLAVPCSIPILLGWRTWRERLLAFLGGLFTFIAIASGNNYIHYYTLAIPLLVLGEISITESVRIKVGKKELLAIVLVVVMLISSYSLFDYYSWAAYSHLFLQDRYNISQVVEDISSKIPEEDKDSVFCYNINPSWYTYADLFPCIKYCGWQNHYISLMPEIYDDLKKTFISDPPAWLVLPEEGGDLPLFLEQLLETDYLLVYDNESYALYNNKR